MTYRAAPKIGYTIGGCPSELNVRRKKPDLLLFLVIFVGLGVVMTTSRAKSDDSVVTISISAESTSAWPVLRRDLYHGEGTPEIIKPNYFNYNPSLGRDENPLPPLQNDFVDRFLLSKADQGRLQLKFRVAYQGAAINLRFVENDFKFTLRRASRAVSRSEPFTQIGIEFYW